MPFHPDNFKAKRIRLIYNRGPLFYAALNLRLFFLLLFTRCSVIHANDLDTLLPSWLVAKLRRKHLVYDTHEYFTGVPELQKRPVVKAIWKAVESIIFPRLKHVFTVNESIANLYRKDFGNEQIHIMRNIPPAKVQIRPADELVAMLPSDCFRIILQGNGINVDRGGEEAVMMMQHLNNCILLIAGSGDVIPKLKAMVLKLKLHDRVMFFDRMPYEHLLGLTSACDLGLSLDKDSNINYRFSLPNKIFDYLRAGIPVLSSDLPELRKVVEEFKIGWLVNKVEPIELAAKIDAIRADKAQYEKIKYRLPEVSAVLSWENECKPLVNMYKLFK